MRTIKFRGKAIDGKEWLYGDLVSSADKKRFAILVNNKESYDECEVSPETVGQFTGLYDKNGRKIFEGDILQCNNNPQDLVKAVYGNFGVIDVETETAVDNVIGWHYEVIPTDKLSKVEPFCLPMPITEFYINRCTMVVIGNIYDNPELMEVNKR